MDASAPAPTPSRPAQARESRPSGTRRHPGVPARPPFSFTITAPPGWEALRGDAPSLRDDLVALVARTPLWASLTPKQREGAGTLLGGVARMAASTGAVATLLRVEHDPAGPVVASITLGWMRTAPLRADLDLARVVAGGGSPVETGLGPGLLSHRQEPIGPDAVNVSTQVVAPVPTSVWLAVITGSTGVTPAGVDGPAVAATDAAVLAVARSLGVRRRET